jgi:antitoxin component YwqK of YwqJK toxin-antitoxin module
MRYILLFLVLVSAGIGQSIGDPAQSARQQGQSESQQSIPESQLEERDGLQYRISSTEPYSGKTVGMFYSGQMRSETSYKNGKKDGKSTTFYENGRLRLESSYKDGKRDGQWIKRDANGQVQFHRFYRAGRKVHQGFY